MATERINIEITETGARRVKAGLEGIASGASGAERTLTLLRRTLGALGFAAVVRSLVSTADAYTNMQNQLKLVTKSTGELVLVNEELLAISNRTRSSLESTATVYTRVSRQAEALGMSQNEVLGFTESLNQAIILSGSSAQEAAMGVRQLGQAIGSGVLRGDELNSVLENTSEVAMVIAKGMGVTIGQLRKLGAEGKITAADIVRAFAEAREELAERFGKTVPTVGQALQVLQNNWLTFVGAMDKATGITDALAKSILWVADNLETLARILGAVAIVISVVLARNAIGFLMTQIKALTAIIAANPLGAVTVAITAAAAALIAFADKIVVSADGFITLADVGVAAFRMIKRGAEFIANQFNLAWEYILQTGHALFGDLVDLSLSFPRAIAKGLDFAITRFLSFSAGVVAVWRQAIYNLQNITGDARMDLTDAFSEAFERSMMKLTESGKGPVERGLDSLMLEAARVSQERREKEFLAEQDKLKSIKGMDRKGTPTPIAGKEDKVTFDKLISEMEKETELLRYNRLEREALANILAFEHQLKRGLTQDEEERVRQLTTENDELRRRADILELVGQPAQDYLETQKMMNDVMREAPQLTEALTQELAELEIQFLQMQQGGSFIDGYARQMRIMQLETRNAVADMGASFASIFGPGGSLSQGIGDAIAQSVVFGESFDQAMKKVAQSVVANVISSLVQLGVNLALNAALGNSLASGATVASVAQAAAVSAAWAPAATLVNAATFGAGAAAGSTALATSLATTKGLTLASGFASGGYTGNGGVQDVAGVVHGKEYVLNARTTRRLGKRNLDRVNSGGDMIAPKMSVNIFNQDIPGIEFETNQLSANEMEIIAKRVVRSEAPNVIASDLNNPSSRTRRSLHANTTAGPKRG